ncbi:YeiH family protein [Variovorax rhizosphaerae]|uniref:Sulfate exporter family transporter n=1 Tax=Variovorax rhizosphaerae TaxID=1836200 RepID=A0ABU8WW31_9BURK
MLTLTRLRPAAWQAVMPGALIATTIALAATFISEHYGGPQLLYALFFGMAFNFLDGDARIQPGIDFIARRLLRFGVALLGARITIGQVTALGIGPVVLVVVGTVATIAFGAFLGKRLERSTSEGLLTGGAVGICGASAALALSAVMLKNAQNQRFTLLTVVGVTALSTLAMILYPAIARLLGLDATDAGIFFGGTIHDVAQVVGAGAMVSPEAADTATVVKLLRVALLVPAVMVFSLIYRGQQDGLQVSERPPLLPAFLVGFVALVALNSIGVIPHDLSGALSQVSRWCLVAAIAALGVKTSFQQLAALGWRPVALMVGETVFLAVLNLGGIALLHRWG